MVFELGGKNVFKYKLFYYRKMDVNILQKACVKFSQLIHEVTGIVFFLFTSRNI